MSPAAAGECTFPSGNVAAVPWALQRVVLDQLWKNGITGKGVTVAVIDTGVDAANPQLRGKVRSGKVLLTDPQTKKTAEGGSTLDPVGHGTKVAGIIAARPSEATGFVGLAPDATILAIRQNDSEGSGNVGTLIQAIDLAVRAGVQVINISQDVRASTASGYFRDKQALADAIRRAVRQGIVVVASSGNDGKEGDTFPAAFPEVIAVGASDRNNERAPFSQYGSFVDVAAPGVDMLSTVPRGGQCVDNGTSFSAPYVTGVAALLRAKHPEWKASQIATRIEQTAIRAVNGHDNYVGWGVVDPVRALADGPEPPLTGPTPDPGPPRPEAPDPAPVALSETPHERTVRLAAYALAVAAVLVAVVAGTAVVIRDGKRRREALR
jgi:type VII secretion-associated serine protease mycosin